MGLRLKLIAAKSDIPEDQHPEFDAIASVLHSINGPVGPFGALMHSPGLAQKVMEAGRHIRLNSTLTKAERETAIITLARERDAGLEWATHVKVAREGGVREEVIAAIRDRADVSQLASDEADVVTFVRQFLRTNAVDDDLYRRLRKRHSDRWLVELAGTLGQYLYISTITTIFGIEAPSGGESF